MEWPIPGEKERWLSEERLGFEAEPAGESRLRLCGCEAEGGGVRTTVAGLYGNRHLEGTKN